MLGAQGIRATGFKRAQGNAHCAKFESNTNRMNFEYAPNMVIVKVHPLRIPHEKMGKDVRKYHISIILMILLEKQLVKDHAICVFGIHNYT